MLTTRRLAAALCALCLIIPAAANAKFDNGAAQPAPAPKSNVIYGDTKYDLQNTQELNGVTGDTKSDLKAPSSGNAYVDKVGSLTSQQLAAAYGTGRPTGTPVASHTSSVSRDEDTNEWRIAAVVEAALLAAFAVGAAVALSGRQRRRAAGLGV